MNEKANKLVPADSGGVESQLRIVRVAEADAILMFGVVIGALLTSLIDAVMHILML